MTYFHINLKNTALNLIKSRENADDIKAGNDWDEVLKMIDNLKSPSASNYQKAAEDLNKRLSSEYPEIRLLCLAVKDLCIGMRKSPQPSHTDYNEHLISFLEIDYYGILVSVLLKHNIISDVKNFIAWVD